MVSEYTLERILGALFRLKIAEDDLRRVPTNPDFITEREGCVMDLVDTASSLMTDVIASLIDSAGAVDDAKWEPIGEVANAVVTKLQPVASVPQHDPWAVKATMEGLS